MQFHTMILWAKAREMEFEEVVDQAYQLLSYLREFGPELAPNYETVWKKSDAKLLKGTYEELKEIIAKEVKKAEKDDISKGLGYTLGFFSSLNDEESAGISLRIGVSDPKFVNSFIVDFPLNLSLYELFIAEKVYVLFKKCILCFEPYFGFVANNKNSDRYEKFWHNDRPTTTHWLNFFGEDLVKLFGEQKIKNAPAELIEKVGNGYLIRLKKLPIDDESEFDLQLQRRLNSYFRL
ncbi:MAG: hypothetical protein K6U80_20160 [Firmicutes bacterium]|nr:hypothetical protein [Bacillota bacterium]